MIKAFDKEKKWISVSYSGQVGICPVCSEEVFGKIYNDKANHFSHYSKSSCGANTGLISDWHLHWQSKFENTEVIFPDKGLRADVVLENKAVIEFQHSDIPIHEIKRREDGYKRMIWLFDCLQFEKNISFKYGFMYWDYPKKNWLNFTKPAFFHIERNRIVQLREINLGYSENKGGYTMPILKATVFRDLSVDEFIDECYMMDQEGRKTFEISENIEILNKVKK